MRLLLLLSLVDAVEKCEGRTNEDKSDEQNHQRRHASLRLNEVLLLCSNWKLFSRHVRGRYVRGRLAVTGSVWIGKAARRVQHKEPNAVDRFLGAQPFQPDQLVAFVELQSLCKVLFLPCAFHDDLGVGGGELDDAEALCLREAQLQFSDVLGGLHLEVVALVLRLVAVAEALKSEELLKSVC